jgi:hypothetical protein
MNATGELPGAAGWLIIMVKMKHINESGFIPLLLTILIVVAAIIYFAFTRVLHAKGGL